VQFSSRIVLLTTYDFERYGGWSTRIRIILYMFVQSYKKKDRIVSSKIHLNITWNLLFGRPMKFQEQQQVNVPKLEESEISYLHSKS